MDLRPDILTAASRITSDYDVSREIRQLSAYLRQGETVHRLACGVYGSGSGLLAVTDYRVLLLRDGRSGQASEGFPLERLSSVEWAAGAYRGTITISDSHSTAELAQVDLADGEQVVRLIRSRMCPGGTAAATSRPRRNAFGNGSGSTTAEHPAVAVTGAKVGAAPESAAPGVPGVRDGLRTPGAPTTHTVERTGRYAVPMQLRQPTPESSGAHAAVERPTPESSGAHASVEQPTSESSGAHAAVEQPTPESSGAHAAVEHPTPESSGAHAVPAPESPAAPEACLPLGAVPVSMLAGSGDRPPAGWPAAGTHDQVHRTGSLAGTTALAGEVPVTRLAAEETIALGSAPAAMRAPTDPTEAAHSTGTGEQPAVSGSAPADRTQVSPLTGDPARIEPTVTAASAASARRRPPGHPGSRRTKKWVWLGVGAAGLIGLAAIGSGKLISPPSPQPPPAAAVNPAPAAVDSADGPVVTIAKVIDADSVEVTGSVTGAVEVLGIIAPRADKEQCGAVDSTAFAVRTLNGTTVTLITDPAQPSTDKAGRRLAFLRLPNGTDYSVLTVGAGLARYYDSGRPVALAAEIKAAQAQAEKSKQGFWGPPCNGKVNASGASAASDRGSAVNAATESTPRVNSAATKPARPVSEDTTPR